MFVGGYLNTVASMIWGDCIESSSLSVYAVTKGSVLGSCVVYVSCNNVTIVIKVETRVVKIMFRCPLEAMKTYGNRVVNGAEVRSLDLAGEICIEGGCVNLIGLGRLPPANTKLNELHTQQNIMSYLIVKSCKAVKSFLIITRLNC